MLLPGVLLNIESRYLVRSRRFFFVLVLGVREASVIGAAPVIRLQQLVDLVADAIPRVDATTEVVTTNKKVGEFHQGVPSMKEADFVNELFGWWSEAGADTLNLGDFELEVRYPNAPRSKCDAVLDISDSGYDSHWAIEFKRFQMVGDNGKNNDYGPAKMLSPYLKDRSLRHDVERLRASGLAERYAVIGYAFRHSFDLIEQSRRRHPLDQAERLDNLRKVCHTNDPVDGVLDPMEMVHLSHEMLRRSGHVVDHAVAKFAGAWRHPCGGAGVVFGWELSNAPP